MDFSAANVPCDIWWKVMAECGPFEIKYLAQCSRLFHDLAKSRALWLRCVRNLGAHEPPSIPKYVSPESLTTSELRSTAISARRRYLQRTSKSSPTVTRNTIIWLKDANPDEVLGEPGEFGLQLFLLPGGEYLLIYWPAGYLQCWSVRDKTDLWVYPDLPEGASEDRPKLLHTFDYDMQENGDIHLLLIDERLQGEEMGDMYPNIVRFSPGARSLEKIYSGDHCNPAYGAPIICRSRGNLLVIYQQLWGFPFGTLTIHFREEDKSVAITDINMECLEIADGFIVYLANLGNGTKSLNVFSVADLYKLAGQPQKTVACADVLSAAILLESKSFSLQRAQLSVNTLHWKDKVDQDRIFIAVLYKDKISKGTPFARFVLNNNQGRGRAGSSIWSLLPIYSLDIESEDNDSPLEFDGRTFASYSTLTSPTLSGQSLVLFHTSNAASESEDTLALATLAEDGGMKFRPFDIGLDYHDTEALCTEFYSGAVVFATKECDSVVIRYFE